MSESDVIRGALRGWKSIAAFFGRDERTVMRWAKERHLPVRRLPGDGRSSVFALPDELSAWLAGARPEDHPEPVPDLPTGKPPEVETVPPVVQPSAAQSAARAPAARFGHLLPMALALLVLAGPLVAAWPRSGLGGARSVAAGSSADPASERAYIQASYDLDNRTPESLGRAAAGFGQAIAADPSNAAAYVGLGEAYLLLPEYSAASAHDAYARAKAAADAAIALAPDLATAHRIRAYVAFWGEGDVPSARREFAAALRLAPDDPVTHHWYATALSASGESARAVAEIERALSLDPQSTSIMVDSGLLLFLAGDREGGLQRLRLVEAARPDQISAHAYLADLALVTGDDRTFLAEAPVASRLRGDRESERLLEAARRGEAAGGRRGMLAAMARALTTDLRTSGSGYYRLARIVALQGDAPRAADLLRRAIAAGEPGSMAAFGDVCFRSLRTSAGGPILPRSETL